MKFVGREKELESLEKEYAKERASFIVIYGRRRIGKTRLIEEFLRNKKEQIYYLAADEKDFQQIKELKLLIGAFFNDNFLVEHEFREWKDLFSYLEKIWPRNKKLVFVIDETTFIIKNNHSFPSYLQQFWDKFLSKTQTTLILSGSLVGLMLKEVGRRTSEMPLEELKLNDVYKFLDRNIEETLCFFSIFGGVPKYLELIDASFKNFSNEMFDKKSFFFREGIYLMTEEFKDISTYSNILKAISEGNTKINEISNYAGIETKKISAYLDILENIGFIEGLAPVTKEKSRFRGRIYLIKDSFLEFWFRFINKNRSLIELDKKDELIGDIYNEINSFIGEKFEKTCSQFLILSKVFHFTKIGKQWGKMPNIPKDKNQYEIDIVALNEQTKEILFAECKWKENVDAENILQELRKKSTYVDWKNNKYYAVFAKSFKKKFKDRNVMLFDLKDIEKELKGKVTTSQ
jgi:hypothetical protein